MSSAKSTLRLLGVAVALLALTAGIWASSPAFSARPAVGGTSSAGKSGTVSTASDAARQRIAPSLAAAHGQVQVIIYHNAAGKAELQKIAPDLHSAGFALPDGSTESIARVDSSLLTKIASVPGVSYISGVKDYSADVIGPDGAKTTKPSRKPSKPANSKPVSATKADGYGNKALDERRPDAWYDETSIHSAAQAWDNGYDGSGVVVAAVDTGVDFGVPDLQGTFARIQGGPYAGWPYAFDTGSTVYWEVYGQAVNVNSWNGGFTGEFVDTTLTVTAPSNVTTTHSITVPLFDTSGTVSHAYTMPLTSKSGVVHVGFHPDAALGWGWAADGGQPALVVVDEHTAGVYDTVYVDMDDDHDFSNDVPITKANPVATLDYDGDGLADQSAGMLYWIADGTHANPGSYTWAQSDAGLIAGQGDLVAFMFTNDIDPNIGSSHGLHVASNVVGQGVSNGPSLSDGSAALPFQVKPGFVWGEAHNAKLAAMSVATFYDYSVSANLYAALGPDNTPGTGDEAQVSTNSISGTSFTTSGWGDTASRYYGQINYHVNPNITYLFSSGNDGPGYGTYDEPSSANTAIMVGASTDFAAATSFEPITRTDQINWGDTMSWSNGGPTGQGRWGPSVLANGAFAPGSYPLNEVGDGTGAWETWGGTSRSTPVAAGVVALIVDAFKQAHGRLPTYSETRHILMSSANSSGNDPFREGAGVIDAVRATNAAAAAGGVIASPSAWQPGSYRGVTYTENDNFMNIMTAGSSASGVISLTNAGGTPSNVTLAATTLRATQVITLGVSTNTSAESPGDITRPDYLVHLFKPSDIPAGTALMVVDAVMPYEQFNPALDYSTAHINDWRLMAYDWTDINGDGKLWNDANGNGAVNVGEADPYEYNRYNYGYNTYDVLKLSVGNPAQRTHDGIYIGLEHRNNSAGSASTTLRIRVTFYQQAPWNWLSLGANSASLAANGSYGLHVTANVPAGTAPGMYEGIISVKPQAVGQQNGPADTSNTQIPVSIAVAATGASFTFGGQGRQDTPYDNNVIWGQNGAEYLGGDTREFYTDVGAGEGGSGKVWLVNTNWSNYAVPTTTIPSDIDTLLYGPAASALSNADPAHFGPFHLTSKGGSANTLYAGGLYRFQTATGTTEEWISGNLAPGLNMVQLHSTTFSGHQFDEPFIGKSGVLAVDPYPVVVSQTCATDLSINVNATLPITPLAVSAFGVSQVLTTTEEITQDATNVYTFTLTTPALIDVKTRGGGDRPASDVDLQVFRIVDGAKVLVGSSGGSTADEEVRQILPQAGTYRVEVLGYAVVPTPGTFVLVIANVDGIGLTLTSAPGSLMPGQTETVQLHTPDNLAPGAYTGALLLGPNAAPGAAFIPITVVVTGECPAATATPTVTATPQPTMTPPLPFSDVHQGDYFFQAVNWLYRHGAIGGYSDNSFKPYGTATRSQLVKIVVLAAGWMMERPATATFADVPRANSFFPYVETAVSHGVIGGYTGAAACGAAGTPCFKPYANVTRAQIAKIITLAQSWALVDPATPYFVDVPRDDPFYKFIETAHAHYAISGYDCGTPEPCPGSYFRPGDNATRGQIAKIVYLAVTTPPIK